MNTTAVQKERKREGGREEEKSYQIDQEEYTGLIIPLCFAVIRKQMHSF